MQEKVGLTRYVFCIFMYANLAIASPSVPQRVSDRDQALSYFQAAEKPSTSKKATATPSPTAKTSSHKPRYQPDASDRAMMRLSGMKDVFDDAPPQYDKDEIRALIESLQHSTNRPPPSGTAPAKINTAPSISSQNKPNPQPANNSRTVQRLGEEVALFALGLLEIGYRFGGKNPDAGLDCSGMVSYVYAEAIKKEMRGTAADIAKRGWAVPTAALRPGDLVFFNTMNRPHSHVGIYIGQSRFIHSPRTGGHIHITSLNNPYFAARFEQGRRYFE